MPVTVGKPLPVYRVRRGWFGRAVLQQKFECRKIAFRQSGHVPGTLVIQWRDVPFDLAPTRLVSVEKARDY